jgi:hypothetical protein
MVNKLLKKIISGKKILDKNNLENGIIRHQELIYKQIEGFLINQKINLRNELIKIVITFMDNTENTDELISIA